MKIFPSLRSKRAKYIVTGGYGFIGSHIVDALLAQEAEVVVLDNVYSGLSRNLPQHHPLLHKFICDISDENSLTAIGCQGHFSGVTAVFHCAAQARIQPSIEDPHTTFRFNVQGTFNILEVMRRFDIEYMVYSASSSSYGRRNGLLREDMAPQCLTPYASTKLMAEELCKSYHIYGIQAACLKYFNVYGERSPTHLNAYSPVIGLFFKQALTGQPITVVGDGTQKRDFTYIDDVVSANILALNELHHSAISGAVTTNIGTGANHTILEIAEKIADLCRDVTPTVRIEHIAERPGEVHETLADNARAKMLLGWTPKVSLDDALKKLKPYYMEQFLKSAQ